MINIRKYERISVKVLKSFFFPKMRSYCLMFIIAVCFLFVFKMKYIYSKSHMLPLEISACQYFGKQAVPDPDLEIRGGGEGGGSSRPLDKGEGGWFSKKIFRPFGPQFGLQIRAPPPPPGPSPGSATEQGTNTECLPHIRESGMREI